MSRRSPKSSSCEFLTNFSAASVMTAGALVDGAKLQLDRGPMGPDPLHIWPSLLDVAVKSLTDPAALIAAHSKVLTGGLQLWGSVFGSLFDDRGSDPATADKRFTDPAWGNPIFDLARRTYAIAGACAQSLASEAPTSNALHKRRIEFFTAALVDALAPTNFLLSNPVAIKEAINTRGESLLRGARNLAVDLERGRGQLAITQTDAARFSVGQNLACTPGKVIFRNDILELIQYSPTTDEVYETPLVIITPWINKYYIVDLRPDNSLVQWLTGQGHTVFVTSWVNPGASHAEKTFDDYMRHGVLVAVGKALEQTLQPRVNAVGYCIGGTILACAMAYLAALEIDSPINSATFFAAQQDFSEAGDLMLFTQEAWLDELEKQMDRAGGVLPGQAMADAFNHLRANDLIWTFFVNNYLLGKDPKPFDLLFWNSDSTRMPKRLHLWYLREFYQNNKLSRGELVMNGVTMNLNQVTTPVYVQASNEDHIAPFPSVYRGARLFGGPTTFTLAGSGHIAGVINHPSTQKYQYWSNPHLPETPDQWLAGAEEKEGSWWPHWAAWLGERSGGMTVARDPSAGPLPPLEDAPGSYVLVRS